MHIEVRDEWDNRLPTVTAKVWTKNYWKC